MAEQDQVPQDEDLLVEVMPDEELAPEGSAEAEPSAAAPPPAAPKVVTAEEGVAQLKERLAARERAAEVAERRAREAETLAQRAGAEVSASRTSVIDSRIGQVDSALETMKGHQAETRRQMEAALQAGDYGKVADLQEQMAENVATVRQLQGNKAQLEHAKRAPQPAPRAAPAASQPQTEAARLEAFLSAQSPRDQAWLRARPEYLTDPAKNKRLIAAHHTAVLDNDAGSDGYYAAVEKQLGITAAPSGGEAPVRRPATVAAPPSRPTPSLGAAPVQQRTVRLTAAEARMAQQMGLSPKDWALEKERYAADKAAGRVMEH